ncbi:hypothetical protein RB598_004053 [Gaeumannomyces tritici]
MSGSIVSLNLPAEYGYVLMVASSSFLLSFIHGLFTVSARKKSGLAYPVSYADKALADKDPNAYAFNCAQRAHANFTENHTSFLGALLISGLRTPLASASLGAAWVFSRLLYAKMYSAGGPKARTTGILGHYLTAYPLIVMAGYTGWAMTR